MRHVFEFIYPTSQTVARNGIAKIKVPKSGQIVALRLDSEAANGAGDTVVDARLGNTDAALSTIFPTTSNRPRIVAGQLSGTAGGLPVNCTQGQTLVIDAAQFPAGGTNGTFYVTLEIEDNTGAGLTLKTVSVNTTSLANNATWTGTVTIARAFILTGVETSAAARVRAYERADKRTADAARPIGVEPTGDHCIIVDTQTAAGALKSLTTPNPIGVQKEGQLTGDTATRSADIPLAVTNVSGATAVITVTFTYYVLEG